MSREASSGGLRCPSDVLASSTCSCARHRSHAHARRRSRREVPPRRSGRDSPPPTPPPTPPHPPPYPLPPPLPPLPSLPPLPPLPSRPPLPPLPPTPTPQAHCELSLGVTGDYGSFIEAHHELRDVLARAEARETARAADDALVLLTATAHTADTPAAVLTTATAYEPTEPAAVTPPAAVAPPAAVTPSQEPPPPPPMSPTPPLPARPRQSLCFTPAVPARADAAAKEGLPTETAEALRQLPRPQHDLVPIKLRKKLKPGAAGEKQRLEPQRLVAAAELADKHGHYELAARGDRGGRGGHSGGWRRETKQEAAGEARRNGS